MFYIWMVTPVLGALRNYAKYHTFDPILFIRTPLLCGLIYNMGISNIYMVSTAERWVLLGYKTLRSFYYDDYTKKKAKYIAKGHIKN